MAADEQVLITDETGEILETDKANVFAVIDGVLLTPPADGRLLPGTTRAAVIRAAHAEGIRVGQKPLTLDDLANASEVFVTNAVAGVLPVAAVDGRPVPWPAGPGNRDPRRRPRPPAPRTPAPGPQPGLSHPTVNHHPVGVTRRPGRALAPRPRRPPGRSSSSSTITTRSPGTSRTCCPPAARGSRSSATTR